MKQTAENTGRVDSSQSLSSARWGLGSVRCQDRNAGKLAPRG